MTEALAQLRYKELGPLKDAAMQAWERARVRMPPLHTLIREPGKDPATEYAFEESTELHRAIDHLTIDNAELIHRAHTFLGECKKAGERWFSIRRNSPLPTTLERVRASYWDVALAGKTGADFTAAVREAYVGLSRHMETLLR